MKYNVADLKFMGKAEELSNTYTSEQKKEFLLEMFPAMNEILKSLNIIKEHKDEIKVTKYGDFKLASVKALLKKYGYDNLPEICAHGGRPEGNGIAIVNTYSGKYLGWVISNDYVCVCDTIPSIWLIDSHFNPDSIFNDVVHQLSNAEFGWVASKRRLEAERKNSETINAFKKLQAMTNNFDIMIPEEIKEEEAPLYREDTGVRGYVCSKKKGIFDGKAGWSEKDFYKMYDIARENKELATKMYEIFEKYIPTISAIQDQIQAEFSTLKV